MRGTTQAWSGPVAALAMWTAVTAVSIHARAGQDVAAPEQEGLIRPRPVAAPVEAPLAMAGPALVRSSRVRPDTSAAQAATGYVGDDTCLVCHESQGAISRTRHGRAADPRTPAAAQGCESCHGPGQAHIDDDEKGNILKFGAAQVDARVASEACLACHTRGAHALWEGSPHDARNLSCSTCHSAHAPKSAAAQLVATSQTELCGTCHRAQSVKMRRASHMPVAEGTMECGSCHNPHGTTNVRLLKVGNWINESCVSCHAEKRGPFLHEHAAGRESCISCHDPHGSSHERMLVAKLPMLCQRCHIGTRHPSTIYDQAQVNNRSNRVIGRSCVQCHINIHGTNHPSGQTFLR